MNSIRKQPNWDQGGDNNSKNPESLLSFFDSETSEIVACPIQLNDISSVKIDESLQKDHVLTYNGTEWKSNSLKEIFNVENLNEFFNNSNQSNEPNIFISSEMIRVGPATGQHIEINSNEIIFQTNESKKTRIYGNNEFIDVNEPNNTSNQEYQAFLYASGNGYDSQLFGIRRFNDNNYYWWVSDDRLKYNETNFDNGINLIKLLNPQKYIMTDSVDDSPENGYETYGFIADEVQTITDLSCNVKEVPDKNFSKNNTYIKALNYNGLLTVSIQAMKEMVNKIESLEARIAQLESSNS